MDAAGVSTADDVRLVVCVDELQPTGQQSEVIRLPLLRVRLRCWPLHPSLSSGV